MLKIGGEAEIRTLGGVAPHDGFQDRCIKPLCHLSEMYNHTIISEKPSATSLLHDGLELRSSTIPRPLH